MSETGSKKIYTNLRDYLAEVKPVSMRLHLGCQEQYLPGYINIDLPPENQTVMGVHADVYSDVRSLVCNPDVADEVRSHHLLEHFLRQEALVLLARWHRWLKPGGLLLVETPDFAESANKFLAANIDDQFVFARHIFGSHEAAWAHHFDFWSEAKYRYVLSRLGYGDFSFEKFSNNLEQKLPSFKRLGIARFEKSLKPFQRFGVNMLPNIVCRARKINSGVDYMGVIRKILAKSLVGRERTIPEVLDAWMKDIHI